MKPILLDGNLDWRDNSVIGVAGKVVKEAKGQDADALILGAELLEARGKWLQLVGIGVVDVEIGGEVAVLEGRHGFEKLVVGGIGAV